MNYEIAHKIIEDKPDEAAHIYIDETHQPRDKHIENLFRDLYDGNPLDSIFRTNFAVYYTVLTGNPESDVARGIFIDADTALAWVERYIGDVSVKEIPAAKLQDWSDDDTCAELRWVAKIKTPYANRVLPAYAPHRLHAILLAAVFTYRAVAGVRLRQIFAPAMRSTKRKT